MTTVVVTPEVRKIDILENMLADLHKTIDENVSRVIAWLPKLVIELVGQILKGLVLLVDSVLTANNYIILTILEPFITEFFPELIGFRDKMFGKLTTSNALNGLMLIFIFLMLLQAVPRPYIDIATQLRVQTINTVLQPLLPPYEKLVNLFFREKISEEELSTIGLKQGLSIHSQRQLINADRPLISVNGINELYLRKVIDDEQLRKLLSQHGYDVENVEKLVKLIPTLLSFDAIRDLYLREIIDKDHAFELLEKLGYTADDIPKLMELFYYVPPPADIIRFAVREAFNPEFVERFGLENELPEELVKYGRHQGISEFWARKYWASHWVLPSPEMAFRMLHRGLITEEDVNALLKAQDYSAFWREKLEKISYNVYTRVDIRRMYKMDILNEEQVYHAFKDIGYDHEHALNLTLFTIQEKFESYRDLSKSQVLEAYDFGIISYDDAVNYLKRLRYDDTTIRYELELFNMKKRNKSLKEKIDLIEDEFLLGIRDELGARTELQKMGLTDEEIDYKIRVVHIKKLKATPKFTKPMLDALLKNGIIDNRKYIDEMRKLGWKDDDIKLLLANEIREIIKGE